MDLVVDHLKEYYPYYIILLICFLPVIFFTRRYSVPAILYTIEIIIYCALMHGAVWCIVGLAAWFKDQSSMKRAFDSKNFVAPDWGTPILEFWKRDLYIPAFLFYIELVLVVLIVFLVWRYRPMKVHRSRKARSFANEGGRSPRRSAAPPKSAAGGRSGARRPGRR